MDKQAQRTQGYVLKWVDYAHRNQQAIAESPAFRQSVAARFRFSPLKEGALAKFTTK